MNSNDDYMPVSKPSDWGMAVTNVWRASPAWIETRLRVVDVNWHKPLRRRASGRPVADVRGLKKRSADPNGARTTLGRRDRRRSLQFTQMETQKVFVYRVKDVCQPPVIG